MKYKILLITLLSFVFTFGQTATEYFDSGKSKQGNNDFEEAIKDYSKAIEMDPTFAEVYYVRASLLFDNDRYKEAITDLNKAISLKPNPIELYMAALILRGKTHLAINNKKMACHDFTEARELGAPVDEEYLQLCGYQEKKSEHVFVKIPDIENWKITEEVYENNQLITLVAHMKKPSEYLSLASNPDLKNVDLIQAMNEVYKTAKSKSKDAVLSFIEKDVKAKEPWIMYSIQNAINEKCNCKVSQVWYLTQGENSFHSCFISIKNDLFTNEKKEEFIKIFKTAKVIYK
ncbi:hypothetical protein ACM46_20535 [Chryseobacterium angstadtii]|uniref:Uncharacterized protein n=1 Tax=Chryseobacterium angstadtii TaxID=558151 RepID=A0A0J7I0J1_9FLAO|nr:tetratricopeptide repeat protein [Chryseobacterium angstadtii]KMQ59479.1 hypothetical protein ACM46_20535 [Chryseobacterium angstadtii]